MTPPLLSLQGISKAFFGTSVLRNVSLELPAGKALALVGENGAGKSTLMNILGGNLFPDAGSMHLDGATFQPHSPRDAERAGIAFIHQELNLFSNLSIEENLFLTRFPRRAGWIDRRRVRQRTMDVLKQVGLDVASITRVDTLSAGERQMVEIAKALSMDAKLIILDEPTTSLTAQERTRLFELLSTLRRREIAMIYISHSLSEVRQLCDQIVVLRDGCVVGAGATTEFDTSRIVALMVGREPEHAFPPRSPTRTDQPLLEMQGVSRAGSLEQISCTLHAGEVVGLAGMMGSGRTELARAIFGLDKVTDGQILLNGQPITRLSTRRRIQLGLAMLTESRRDDGLLMQASIFENCISVAARQYAKTSWLGRIKRSSLREAVQRIGHSVRLSTNVDWRQPVRTLSGGNQQKVVLAKWLLNRPKVLILDEPTRGIDVGAKYEIYCLINALAAAGASVLMISSELEELMGMCDRILVINRGEIQDDLSRTEFDPARILRGALRRSTRGEPSMNRKVILLGLLNQTPLFLFIVVFGILGSLSGKFLEPQNLVNILIQSSSIAVAAMGMTLVLLTAGVDLSVGSVMFLAVAVSGKLVFQDYPVWLAFCAALAVGCLCGIFNAVMVTCFRVIAFVATLALLFIARGFGLWLTETRAMNMPDDVTLLGAWRPLGVPFPVWSMLLVAVALHWMLTCTPVGRQIYAIGCDSEAARKAGVRVVSIAFLVYVLCGMCAALSGLLALIQTGAVSPSFGQQKEFAAIAAAVLGGTSLFGGRGHILPGTLFGAVLLQTVDNGLVIINADPYLYPMILSVIIFLAVLVDTSRARIVQGLTRRNIRVTH